MAAEGGNIIRHIYRGEVDEFIPLEATHVTIVAIKVPALAFAENEGIVEVICHEDVKTIGDSAFFCCPNLRRVIMPGVKEVELGAFNNCPVLTDVECDKVELIGEAAFGGCESLRSINLPSARIVEKDAFWECYALTNAKFGNRLESLGERTLGHCFSLERITIPLKEPGLITADSAFQGCRNLYHVDLVEEEILRGTAAALLLEEWRNDVNQEIDSINQILSNTWEGQYGDNREDDVGGKTEAIRTWIRSVLDKIVHYKVKHRRVLSEAATAIHQFALPNDILMNNVLPFLALPSHTFEGENNEEEEAANVDGEGASEREENEQEGHDAEQGDDHDFSRDDEEEVGNEESDSRRVKKQRR